MSKSIVFMGTPDFAKYQLEYLHTNGIDIKGVVTMPDKKMGRGMKLGASAVKQYAEEQNLPVLQPTSLKDETFLSELKALQADLFVVVAFRMLPKLVWAMPELGTINLHASLLPEYRGAAPINWAIINGETESGITTFLIDEEIDTGKIIDRNKVSIAPTDNAGHLHDKLMIAGAKLLLSTVNELFKGTASALPQEEYSDTKTWKHAPKIFKEDCAVNLAVNATVANNKIRGLSPFPGAYVNFQFQEKEVALKIFDCEPISIESNAVIGSWVTDNKTYAHLVCAENTALDIKEMQIPGKKRMDIRSILAGNKLDAYLYLG